MRHSLLLALCGVSLAVGTANAQTRHYLNIGDPAPALTPHQWLKGDKVAGFEKGKVYVVEFWATWCGPCKENIPHLTELAKKFKGTASITGVSIWENNDSTDTAYLKKVAAFVKDQGSKMDYNVAVDGPTKKVADAWMKAADENGIPTTFIVGKDGKIAWIGHPEKLEAVLTQVVADKFDVQAAATRRATEVETTRPISEAMAGKKYANAIKLMDAAVAKKPDSAPFYTYNRLVALFHIEPKTAVTLVSQIMEESEENIGAYRMVVSIMATEKDLSPEVYQYGKALNEKALAKNEMKYMFLAMGAEINASLGDKQGAVNSQEQAVKEAEGDSHAPKEFVAFLKKKLDEFKAKLKG